MSPDLIRKEDLATRKRKSDISETEEAAVMVRTSQNLFLQHIGM